MRSPPQELDPSIESCPPKYRPDIDGLRAIAVLAVVGFHAFPTWIKGGFVGVDIFFVISGFLISTIIFGNFERGNFSFIDFYSRRITRIFPALLVVLIATLAFAWFYLPGWELELIGKHTVAATGFVSNLVLWSESSYFDLNAKLKPLLHLWSLGVEEQFYLFWPLLIWLSWKMKLNVLTFTLVIATASFVLNVSTISSHQTAVFYSPLTRLWELLIGSSLASLMLSDQTGSQKLNANVKSFLGVVLITVGVLLVTKKNLYPGWYALLPTLGTFLIISSGTSAWVNRVVLSNKCLVWFGLISYPLYLWHWVLLSLVYILEGPSHRYVRIALVFVSIIFAWLTYKFIEKPIRLVTPGKSKVRHLTITMIAVCLIGLMFSNVGKMIPNGEIWTQLNEIRALRDAHKMYGEKSCFKYKKEHTAKMFVDNGCLEVKYSNRPTVLLIGDSHSASLSLGLRPVLENANINFLQVSTGWCEPTSDDDKNIKCKEINDLVLEKIGLLKPRTVVINSHWVDASRPPYYLGKRDFILHLFDYLQKIKNLGVEQIFIVGQIPTWKKSLPQVLAQEFVSKDLPIPDRTFIGVKPASLIVDEVMRDSNYPKGVIYLSVKDILCDNFGCLVSIGPDLGKDLVVWDYGHLTQSASRFVVRKLFVDSKLIQKF
jgi:peptidoglycan/LPS O-acetylase OafA/YrhL